MWLPYMHIGKLTRRASARGLFDNSVSWLVVNRANSDDLDDEEEGVGVKDETP